MNHPRAKTRRKKTIFDKQEPFVAIDNMGQLYAILTPREARAAKKAGRKVVNFVSMTPFETKVAMQNLLGAALDSLGAVNIPWPP